jgi:hypothetical protein
MNGTIHLVPLYACTLFVTCTLALNVICSVEKYLYGE